MGLLLIIYFNFLAREPEMTQQTDQGSDSVSKEQITAPKSGEQPEVTSLERPKLDSATLASLGIFAKVAEVETSEMVFIENDDVKIGLDAAGGKIVSVLLKQYKGPGEKQVVLLNEQSSTLSETVALQNGSQVNLNSLQYSVEQPNARSVVFRLGDGNDEVKRTYSLADQGFVVDYDVAIKGQKIKPQSAVSVDWDFQMIRQEKDPLQSRQTSTINYFVPIEGHSYLSENSNSIEQIRLEKAEWISFKQKFFNSGIITDSVFQNLELTLTPTPEEADIVKRAKASFSYPIDETQNLRFYFGPNEYNICSQVAQGYEENVYLGWWVFGFLNRWAIAPLFHALESGIANYGLIILILVLIVKSVLFPLTFRSYKSMATMKALKPELDELREKYKDDPQKLQLKSMDVYRSFGVNPLAGCIPMIAQIPVFIALYNFFPNAIELRQERFLWADDLSSYDSIVSWSAHIPLVSTTYGNHVSLFTLLWAGSMILQAAFNAQITVQQQPGPMKYLPYFMPVVLLFVFNSFAAGLTFYYFVSNIITVGQQWAANKFLIDEEKIRKVLEERKLKRSSQSKMSNKIEELRKLRGKKKN